ncbi:MAG: hypothetical protein PF692_04010 [Kiritimatiellae bacterium]|nr:hypothetical protein [Kiritimatiellia bacterium]
MYKFLISVAGIALLMSSYCSLYWLWFHMYDVLILNDVIPWVNHKALIYMFRSVNQFMPIGVFCLIAAFLSLILQKKKISKTVIWLFCGYFIVGLILLYGIHYFWIEWRGIVIMSQEIWWL